MKHKLRIWMRIVVLSVSFFTANKYANGQNTPDEYSNRLNYILQHIDKSQIPTGYLMDYGIPFVDLKSFNGFVNADNLVDIDIWRSIYATFYSSRIHLNSAEIDSLSAFNQKLDQIELQNLNVIPLSVLNFSYAVIKEDALERNLFTVYNDQLYDVPNRAESPYEIKTLFAVAPSRYYIKGSRVEFEFKPELFYKNNARTISDLRIDFGDNKGYKLSTMNAVTSETFTESGLKTITFKVSFSDGSIMHCQTKVYVDIESGDAITNALEPDVEISVTSERFYKFKQGKGKLQIKYAQGNTSIKKPLIVVEGLDTWKITDPNQPNENKTISSFIRSIDRQTDFGSLRTQISDIDKYDIIYLDYEDGVDYIQRNAFLLQTAIDTINSLKNKSGSIEKNVVLGLSMGGLVARYALRDMELRGENHDTRLYISMDSPHLGANIPLAVQVAALHLNSVSFNVRPLGIPSGINIIRLNEQFTILKKAQALLSSPAVRQLLIEQSGQLKHPSFNAMSGGSEAQIAFMDEYRQLGYPTQTRNIAISNGSECGITQPYGPYHEYFSFSTTLAETGLSRNIFISPLLGVLSLLTNKPILLQGLFGTLSTKTKLKFETSLNALPDKQEKRIYNFRLWFENKFLGVININVNISREQYFSISRMLPLDNTPGSNFSGSINLPIQADNTLQPYNFIPTVSALDIGSGNQSLSTQDLVAIYTASNPPSSPKNTPFANFITASRGSEPHLAFTRLNGTWLLNELRGAQPTINCLTFCQSNTTIQGSDFVCADPVTFTTQAISGYTYTWSVPFGSGLEIVGSATGTSVQVRKIGSGVQSSEVRVRITGPC